jgi:hypothetical protein
MFKLKFDEITEDTMKIAQLTVDNIIYNNENSDYAEITISFNCGEYYFSGNIKHARQWLNILKDVVKLPKK